MSVSPATSSSGRSSTIAFIGAVLFGGLNGIGVRQTILELAPFWSGTLRFVAAGLIMLAITVLLRRRLPRGRSLTGAMLYGAIGFAGSMAFMYQGLRETPAGTAQVLVALTPLMTFFFAIAHGQERFRFQGLVGALIAVAGVAIVFADRLGAEVPVGSMLLIVLGTACIAEGGVILKAVPRSDPFGTNAVAMLTGAVLLLILSVVAGEGLALPSQGPTWLALGYLVVFGSIGLFGLYVFVLTRWSASRVSYMTLLLPLVTILAAAVLTGEQMTVSFAIGGAVILAGVYVGSFLHLGPIVRAIPPLAKAARPVPNGLPECVLVSGHSHVGGAAVCEATPAA